MTAVFFTHLGADSHDMPAAVRVGDEELSRADLAEAASAMAGQIAGATRVIVNATASLETVVAVVGGMLAGVTVVPVPADSGPAERRHIIDDSGADLWLGDVPDGVDLPTIPIDTTARSAALQEGGDLNDTSLMLYTSGTTGPPKGVEISRSAMASCIDALSEAWQWTPDDKLVHGLPLFHVHGLVLGVLGGLRIGSPVHHTVRPKPQAYVEAEGSLYFGVPTVWSRVCADPSALQRLSSARLLVSGSAALPAPVFDQMKTVLGRAPVERYGMSETLITLSTRADGHRRRGSVGLPLRGVQARVVDSSGRLVTPDGETIGDLEVTGASLFNGYHDRPHETAESWTSDRWFRTGDVATVDPEGMHRLVGRASIDLIKSGGYRVGAGEVEDALLGHPAVKEAAVVGQPDDDLGQRIVAYVVADGVTSDDLSDFVASTLSVHKRPREVRIVGSLPRNAMGKVQKSLL